MDGFGFITAMTALLLAAAVIISIVLVGNKIAHENNLQTRHFMDICVAQGYDGFTNDTQDDNVMMCYNK